MKHIQNKLTRAIVTKDWRLVKEAWWMAGESEVGVKNFEPREPVNMREMMVQRESE